MIGCEIGKQNISKAKEYFNLLNRVAFFVISLACLGVLIFKETIVKFYSKSEDVQKMTLDMIYLIIFTAFSDCYQGYVMGAIKGLGIQSKIVPINFVAYWLMFLPISYFVAF